LPRSYTIPTIEDLCLSSGNVCAFTGCNCILYNFKEKEKIGEKAHIEAVEMDGPRFNESQTPKQRNSFDNLMLMCPNHHTLIDKYPEKYSVSLLKEMKRRHEEASHERLERKDIAPMAEAFIRETCTPKVFRGEKTIFVGREKEINEIAEHLKEFHTPLSIVGAGGIGKSAVAFKIIHQIENKNIFDIVIDIYLRPEITFDSFLSDLAAKLSLPIQTSYELDQDNRKQLLLKELGSLCRPLILLDNYENISEGIVNHNPEENQIKIHNFLDEVPPNTSIILTSRHRNNLPGEYLYQIAGLANKEGIDLFVTLAKKYLGNNISENILKTIGKLSEMVGGHPLAIKLLSGSYQGGGIYEIESMLRGIDIDLPNVMEQDLRLRSLRSCLDYSFDKLGNGSQSLLLQLVYFKSPIPAKAVEDILKSKYSLLQELFIRGFLERNEFREYGDVPQKFYLYDFHPVIREYLQTKAKDENFEPDFEIEYSEFYENLIRQANHGIGKEEYVLLRKIVTIISERQENDFKNAINLMRNPEIRSLVANHLGLVLLDLRLDSEAMYYHNLCLKIDQETNRYDRVVTDYENIGNCYLGLGRTDKALEFYQKALDLGVGLRDDRSIAKANSNLGLVMLSTGELDKALDYCKKAIVYHRRAFQAEEKLDDKRGLSQNYTNLASIHHKKGNYMLALGCNQKALYLDNELSDQSGIATDYNNIGIAIKRLGDPDKALEYFKKALEIDNKLDDKRGQLRTYKNIVKAFLEKGDDALAHRYVEDFLAVWAQLYGPVTADNIEEAWQSTQYLHLVTGSD
jgi:tetratricopeptide (TPR) repeat protein